MKEITVIRRAYLPDVTLGNWFVDDQVFYTLEEHWLADPDGPGGQRREGALVESCIPDGVYDLVPHFSQKYPEGVWAFVNHELGVYHQPADRPPGQTKWGRIACLVHRGNHTRHIEGCMLVGLRFGRLEDLPAVLDSGIAITRLRAILGTTERHRVTIRSIRGTNETLPVP